MITEIALKSISLEQQKRFEKLADQKRQRHCLYGPCGEKVRGLVQESSYKSAPDSVECKNAIRMYEFIKNHKKENTEQQ